MSTAINTITSELFTKSSVTLAHLIKLPQIYEKRRALLDALLRSNTAHQAKAFFSYRPGFAAASRDMTSRDAAYVWFIAYGLC